MSVFWTEVSILIVFYKDKHRCASAEQLAMELHEELGIVQEALASLSDRQILRLISGHGNDCYCYDVPQETSL